MSARQNTDLAADRPDVVKTPSVQAFMLFQYQAPDLFLQHLVKYLLDHTGLFRIFFQEIRLSFSNSLILDLFPGFFLGDLDDLLDKPSREFFYFCG